MSKLNLIESLSFFGSSESCSFAADLSAALPPPRVSH